MRTMSKLLLSGAAALTIASQVHAAESASGVINLESINGSGASQTFTYDIVLKDTGSTDIGSFWYAWIPYLGVLPDNYYNFLPSDPTAENNPTGWVANIVGPGIFDDGYSIQWVSDSNPMTPGSTFNFGFTTPDKFTTVTGSPFGFPTGYSYVYQAGPEAAGDSGGFLVVAAGSSTVPEPATLSLLATVAAAVCCRRPRRPVMALAPRQGD